MPSRSWWLAFLALLGSGLAAPGLDAQGTVCVDLAGEGPAATFGPESWKTSHALRTRNEYQFQNMTRFWGTTLGYRVTLPVKIVECDGGGLLPGAGEFEVEAYIDVGSERLYAYVANGSKAFGPTVPPVAAQRFFDLVFDADGASIYVDPESPQASKSFPALGYGLKVVNVNVYYAPQPGESRDLAAQAQLSFFVETAAASVPLPLVGFPERGLRKFSDFGEGPFVAFSQSQVAKNESLPVVFRFGGSGANKPVNVTAFYAVRSGPSVQTPAGSNATEGTPLDEVLEEVTEADEAGVEINAFELGGNGKTDANGTYAVEVDFEEVLAALSGELVFVAGFLTGAQGVAASTGFMVPVGSREAKLRAFRVSEAPQPDLGRVEVTFHDLAGESGNGPAGLGPGDLVVLEPQAFGYRMLAKGSFDRRDSKNFIRATVSTGPTVNAGTNRYAVVGLLYQSQDAFYAVGWGERGFSVFAPAARLVEGESSAVRVSFQSHTTNFDQHLGDPGLDTALRIEAALPDGTAFRANLTVAELGTGFADIPIESPSPGDHTLALVTSTGDLVVESGIPVRVLSEEEFERRNRKWWDVPGFDLPLLLLAALGAALLAARRRGF